MDSKESLVSSDTIRIRDGLANSCDMPSSRWARTHPTTPRIRDPLRIHGGPVLAARVVPTLRLRGFVTLYVFAVM